MLRSVLMSLLALALANSLVVGESRAACPFCPTTSQTLTDEIAAMDAAIIAVLDAIPKAPQGDDEVIKARFRIVKVIKGEKLLAKTKAVESVYFGETKPGKKFFITGVGPQNIEWSTPLPLSDRGERYILALEKLPKSAPERLEFFQQYFEDEDDLMARDAYDEFAKAPYEVVQALKPKLQHDKLVGWLKNVNVSTGRRRLYFTLLGVCGGPDDLPLLESMIKSEDRKQRAGLDAMLACYLMLKGPEGLPLVEESFLANTKSDYAETYAAIMALRFHGNDVHVIPKPRVVRSLRIMLDRPNLTDLVIPDLARWEDWSSMDRLVKLFKEADDKTSWVKVPVINFLRACPLPEAKQRIMELEKLDPESVRRANTLFPVAAPTAAPVKT